MEESCFGFLIAGGLCSKPGRSLCERIKLTFATAQGCLHSLSLGRHDRFGRLCNLGLPKTLRFSLQRHKTWEFGLRRIPGIICRFSLWNSAGCVRIWLEGLGKVGLFGCQSANETCGLFPKSAKAESVSFGLWLLVSSGFLGAKAGFVEGCNLWNVLYNPETYVW